MNRGVVRYSNGHERAMRHVEEARLLRAKYGGVYDDVKDAFFNLPAGAMRALLNDYERWYGEVARDYAEQTLPRWQSGEVRMSGQTMTRLLDLVPKHLSEEAKLALVRRIREETLKRVSRTTVELSVAADENQDELLLRVLQVISQQAAVKLPAEFFELRGWINRKDAVLMQKMTVEAEQSVLYARAADLFLILAQLRRLRMALPKAKMVEATFEIPSATLLVRIKKAQQPMNNPASPFDNDDDILAKLQKAESEAELRSGKTTLSEYVLRNMDSVFTPQEQNRLRMLAAQQGLELDKLKTEIIMRHQTSAHDIEAFKNLVQDLQAQGMKSNVSGEYQTPSGRVRIDARTSRFGCFTLALAVAVIPVAIVAVHAVL